MEDGRFIWLVILLVIMLGAIYLRELRGKDIVREELEQKGFQVVQVRIILFGGGGSILSFEVEYSGKNGVVYKNMCLVKTGGHSGRKVYWDRPIE